MIASSTKDFWKKIEVSLIVVLTVSPLIPRIVGLAMGMFLLLESLFLIRYRRIVVSVEASFVLALLFFGVAIVWDLKNTLSGQPYSLANLLYPFYFICGYLIAKRYEKKEFYDIFEKVIFVCALLSFVGMAIYFVKPSLVYSFPQYTHYGMTHRTIFFFNYMFAEGWMSNRNTGIAWEPGLFQILLNLAFQVSIATHKDKKLFVRVCVYSLAVVLTRSTIGYVVLAINLFSLIRKHKKYLPVLISVGVVASAFIASEVVYQFQNKLWGSSAFATRFEPMVNVIKTVWYRPFGLGGTAYDAVFETQNLGSYDCYTQILLRYGYPILIYLCSRLFKIFKRDNKYLAIILAISFLSEPIWGGVLMTTMYYLENKVAVGVINNATNRESNA